MTKKQKNDIDCVMYFIPNGMKHIKITDKDKSMFLEWSERGMHKDKINPYTMNGLNALVQGKEWRGVHMQMYEEGVLDGSVPYFTILGGFAVKPKWWKFWDKGHRPIPRIVADYIKKEMFKGKDADLIEKLYLQIC